MLYKISQQFTSQSLCLRVHTENNNDSWNLPPSLTHISVYTVKQNKRIHFPQRASCKKFLWGIDESFSLHWPGNSFEENLSDTLLNSVNIFCFFLRKVLTSFRYLLDFPVLTKQNPSSKPNILCPFPWSNVLHCTCSYPKCLTYMVYLFIN